MFGLFGLVPSHHSLPRDGYGALEGDPKPGRKRKATSNALQYLGVRPGGCHLGLFTFFVEIPTIICDIKIKNRCFVWCSVWYVLNMNWDVAIICTENWITEWKIYTVLLYCNVLYICISQSPPSIYNVISQSLNSKLQPANEKTYRFDFVDSHLLTKMSKFNWTSNWLVLVQG